MDDLYTVPRDSLQTIQADQAFLQRLLDRLDSRVLTNSNRMWMNREEIRNLRRIAGIRAKSKVLQNRRIRVHTVKSLLTQAEDRLAARAAALVSEKIAPLERPYTAHDDFMDNAWTQMRLQQLQIQQLQAKVNLTANTFIYGTRMNKPAP